MTEAEQERARVVWFLMEEAARREPSYVADALHDLADSIERGDHLKGVE